MVSTSSCAVPQIITMINTRDRERLLNALIYFSDTMYGGKIKLFKLLYALDFEHFQATGLSVTGLKYKAWDMGPVPKELYYEWDNPRPDFVKTFIKTKKKYPNGDEAYILKPQVAFSDLFFSPYQVELMGNIAKKYFNHTATGMTADSHQALGCWDHVYNFLNDEGGDIPYTLILERKNSTRDQQVMELSKEYEAIMHNYKDASPSFR